jgi:polyhydroxyalkanoate synthesis regulator phasin
MADLASSKELLERLALAAVGAVVLTAERAESLAEELAERGGLSRADARQVVADSVSRWRGDASRLGEHAGENLQGLFEWLGLVTCDEIEELELRVAQLEHRLRLVEAEPEAPPRLRSAKPRS